MSNQNASTEREDYENREPSHVGLRALLGEAARRIYSLPTNHELRNHGKTLRRIGIGEDTRTDEHILRGKRMRGLFGKYHAHCHGLRWPDRDRHTRI